MSITPKSSWPWVRTLLHSVYDQADADAVHAQYDRVQWAPEVKLPAVATHLEDARPGVLTFTAFPREVWRQISELQPPRTPQPRDPPPDRRRRDLPRPQLPDPARR